MTKDRKRGIGSVIWILQWRGLYVAGGDISLVVSNSEKLKDSDIAPKRKEVKDENRVRRIMKREQ